MKPISYNSLKSLQKSLIDAEKMYNEWGKVISFDGLHFDYGDIDLNKILSHCWIPVKKTKCRNFNKN